MNRIYDKLVKARVDSFVSDYKELSRQLFVDEGGKLIHPGEFGAYRERVVKSLFEPFLPERLAIGSGFIITPKNHISSQCDIIIYDRQATPRIETDEQRFFPIESVVGVIETKSCINKYELRDSLRKLSQIKKLRRDLKGESVFVYRRRSEDKPSFDSEMYIGDQMITALVCERLSFLMDNQFDTFFNQSYEGEKPCDRHNAILCVDDQCFLYLHERKAIACPCLSESVKPLSDVLIRPSKEGYNHEHVLQFLDGISKLIRRISVVEIDPTNYMGTTRKAYNSYKNDCCFDGDI